MERQFYHSSNGQEIEESDINLVAEDAALADDRVFAELFRLRPYDSMTMGAVTKGILGYSEGPTLEPFGASGSVKINPFRPLVGCPTESSTDTLLNWRNIRSAVFVGDSPNLYTTQSLTANSSGNPRWDLVYCRVDIDTNEANVDRYVATAGPPATETLTSLPVVKTTLNTVGVVSGATSATPDLPSLPVDSSTSFFVPLSYILVPDGFSSTTTVLPGWIFEACPVVPISSVTSTNTSRPASAQNTAGGAVISTSVIEAWPSGRPEVYMPPSMVGSETLYIALNLQDANPTNWSQGNNTVIDDSRDWRNRVFHWIAQTDSGGSTLFAWDESAAGNIIPHLDSAGANTSSGNQANGMGRSFNGDVGDFAGVCYLTDQNVGGSISSGEWILIGVNMIDGKLYIQTSSNPGVRAFVILTASSQFANR